MCRFHQRNDPIKRVRNAAAEQLMNIETTGGILQVDSRAGIENFEALNNVEVCNEE